MLYTTVKRFNQFLFLVFICIVSVCECILHVRLSRFYFVNMWQFEKFVYVHKQFTM